MNKKRLCFIANQEAPTMAIYKQMSYFLEDYLDIRTWCLMQNAPNDLHENHMFVTSSYTSLERAKKYLPKDRKVIVASRTLNTNNLEKLFDLITGTPVLIVDGSEETSLITESILKRNGITHLKYHRYYPGKKDVNKNIKAAITPGLKHLVPPFIKNIVDLGVKTIDISTYAQIVFYFGLPEELVNNISHYYLKQIVSLGIRSKQDAIINDYLKSQLEVIINSVDEAILAADKNGKLILTNSALEEMLSISKHKLINKSIEKVLPQLDLKSTLQDAQTINNEICNIDQKYYIFNSNPILGKSGKVNGAAATLKPIGKVKELETRVRQELRNKGHIAKYSFQNIIGVSKKITNSIELGKQFAQNELTILIEGENGTGKELFAQAIHNYSERKNGPFVAINFAALPDNLVESELFGYTEGAFTGAKKGGCPGLFEEAHHGTIFLDEIGDSTISVQKKLLRVLEEREVRRVGATSVTPIDVRVIAATNRNLKDLMKRGLFREDLFYRLCALPLYVPPLRERKDDILMLVDYFTQKNQRKIPKIDDEAKLFFIEYPWPGNIRELENVLNYVSIVTADKKKVTISDLPRYLTNSENHTTNNDRFDYLKEVLKEQKLLQDGYALLCELYNSRKETKSIGRDTLRKRISKNHKRPLNDYQLKKNLRRLRELGLIETGKTKQGSKISSKGLDFYNYLRMDGNILVFDN